MPNSLLFSIKRKFMSLAVDPWVTSKEIQSLHENYKVEKKSWNRKEIICLVKHEKKFNELVENKSPPQVSTMAYLIESLITRRASLINYTGIEMKKVSNDERQKWSKLEEQQLKFCIKAGYQLTEIVKMDAIPHRNYNSINSKCYALAKKDKKINEARRFAEKLASSISKNEVFKIEVSTQAENQTSLQPGQPNKMSLNFILN
jgi:hypothetical protein